MLLYMFYYYCSYYLYTYLLFIVLYSILIHLAAVIKSFPLSGRNKKEESYLRLNLDSGSFSHFESQNFTGKVSHHNYCFKIKLFTTSVQSSCSEIKTSREIYRSLKKTKQLKKQKKVNLNFPSRPVT